MSSEYIVELEDLGKRFQIYDKPSDRLRQMIFGRRRCYYRDFWALRGVNLQINRGETVGIIGSNGSGKSTLLQLIGGTLNPSAGRIKVRGRVAALLELGAGFNPEFTGRENVMLSASLAGMSRERTHAIFESVAAFADIGGFIEQPVKTYSSGMFVRLAFALQVHTEPEVFLVDEAMAVGDHRFVQKCYARMTQMTAAGVSLLLVSHDTTAIKMLCDRALWLDKGEIRMTGPASDVVDAYRQWADGIDHSVVQTGYKPEEDPNGRLLLEDLRMLDENGNACSAFLHGTATTLEARITNRGCTPGARLRFGFSIRNNRGIEITGSNSSVADCSILAPQIGEMLEIRVSFDLPLLAGGRYSISANVDVIDGSESVTEFLVRDGLLFDVDERLKVFTLLGLEAHFAASTLALQNRV